MPNAILVSFDALRYDHVPGSRHGEQTAPFIGSVVDEGVAFTRHVSTGSGTSTAFPGIHASSLPLDHGYAGLNEEHTSLAEVLSDASVQTVGVTGQTSCSSIYNYDRGFDVFEDWVDDTEGDEEDAGESFLSRAAAAVEATPFLYPIASELKFQYEGLRDVYDTPPCPYPRAETLTDSTLSLVDRHVDPDEEFFVWVHYVEPHAPYYPPPDCIDLFHDGDFDLGRIRRVVRKARRARPEIIDGSMVEAVNEAEIAALRDYYAAATRYVDREARRLVEGFTDRGMLDDTVLFFTADHGEELFDRGTFGHRSKMYEELVHVPLAVRDESDRFGEDLEVDSVTSHLDLAPTITDLYGIEAPDEWRGVSLGDFLSDGTGSTGRDHVISELCHTSGLGGDVRLDTLVAAVSTDRWKYIQNRQLDTEELYDLQADPEERHDCSADRPDVLAEMLDRFEARLAEVSETSREVAVSANVQRQLEELGYVE